MLLIFILKVTYTNLKKNYLKANIKMDIELIGSEGNIQAINNI